MLFSDEFKITLKGNESWFDPILSKDVKLFIDPFLIFENEFGPFIGSHSELIAFYDHAFQLVAKAAGRHDSLYWRAALATLKTPEVEELSLGYTSQGTDGAGSGAGKARLLAQALEKAIAFGLSTLLNPRSASLASVSSLR